MKLQNKIDFLWQKKCKKKKFNNQLDRENFNGPYYMPTNLVSYYAVIFKYLTLIIIIVTIACSPHNHTRAFEIPY